MSLQSDNYLNKSIQQLKLLVLLNGSRNTCKHPFQVLDQLICSINCCWCMLMHVMLIELELVETSGMWCNRNKYLLAYRDLFSQYSSIKHSSCVYMVLSLSTFLVLTIHCCCLELHTCMHTQSRFCRNNTWHHIYLHTYKHSLYFPSDSIN